MKVREHPAKAAESVWCLFSEDGRRGATAIRYADGSMEVINGCCGTSQGLVKKSEAKQWAREVAAKYFTYDNIADAKRRLDEAMERYQRVVAEMPPAKVVLAKDAKLT